MSTKRVRRKVWSATKLRPHKSILDALFHGIDAMRLDSNVRVRLKYDPKSYNAKIQDHFDQAGQYIKQASDNHIRHR